MRLPQSKIGLAFSISYLLVSVFLILSQGLFGESFITLLLGLPWSYIMAYFNLYVVGNDILLFLWLLGPIIVNAFFLYWIGVGIEKLFKKAR